MGEDSKKFGKVLIVEDDRFIRKAYEVKFGFSGFEVITASDGGEAIEMTKAQKPDLVLLDLMLPTVSGFEYLRVIKNEPETKNIPVIIISNLGQEADRVRGLEMGADAYFVKAHIKVEELVEESKKLIAKKSEPKI